ncbi:thiaminase II [Stappia sp. F7233]|uniref:Aminopyrimidine aminohydrolase n=1 Tax=Stappia albiluteola TaxID=2758565 RepID=A0A839AD88_9HYPH|nr:thiaminase II [Stappia albiluteola]MBA5776924.1 thiaminase II [Stappia albiluteola]
MSLFERLKSDATASWNAYVNHAFVRRLGDGTLPMAAFRHYLVQDYLFLIHFARANGLAVYKAATLEEMRFAHRSLKAILDIEMDLHVRLCGEWGLTPAELEKTPEHSATMAYTRYVLETGLRGDLLDLHVALAPCVLGYAEIADSLVELHGGIDTDNPYAHWISEYSGDAYREVAASAADALDRLAETRMTGARYPHLLTVFDQATRLEVDFWQMGLDAAREG